MKKIEENLLKNIKGGSIFGDIAKGVSSLFDSFTNLFTGISSSVETGIFSQEVLSTDYDSLDIDMNKNTIKIDKTKLNQQKYELDMQKLKEFGSPSNQPDLLIF